MKRIFIFLAIILVFVAAGVLLSGPVAVNLAARQLGKVFAGSAVSIREAKISPFRQISFFDIRIQRQPAYSFNIPEITIRYDLPSLLHKHILKVSLKNATIDVKTPKENILVFKKYLSLGPGGAFVLGELELDDLTLNVTAADVLFKARMSAAIDPQKQALRAIDLSVSLLKSGKITLKNASLRAGGPKQRGEFLIGEIQYDKLAGTNVKSAARLEDGVVFLDSLSGQVFNGEIAGRANLGLSAGSPYFAHVKAVALNMENAVDDLKLKEKFTISGLMGGEVTIAGRGARLDKLDGEFAMMEDGGVLVIRDTRFLENLASGTNQPLDLLVESFRNYRYNTGAVAVKLKEGNIHCDVAFDGEAGKRDLNITLHNIH
ncbi:MAG: hypothetical protein KAS66_14655 [Candidatus Omnitrophica bacterium]|nr:hypothetical protein [Candidatus Omnitrophota bacterium]